jgi:hypothetical protein
MDDKRATTYQDCESGRPKQQGMTANADREAREVWASVIGAASSGRPFSFNSASAIPTLANYIT